METKALPRVVHACSAVHPIRRRSAPPSYHSLRCASVDADARPALIPSAARVHLHPPAHPTRAASRGEAAAPSGAYQPRARHSAIHTYVASSLLALLAVTSAATGAIASVFVLSAVYRSVPRTFSLVKFLQKSISSLAHLGRKPCCVCALLCGT